MAGNRDTGKRAESAVIPLIREDGYSAEVIRAAYRSIGKNNILVSRRSIENHLLENPGEFPLLSNASRISRRRAISHVMNARFPPWSQGHGVNQTTFVWIILGTQPGNSGICEKEQVWGSQPAGTGSP